MNNNSAQNASAIVTNHIGGGTAPEPQPSALLLIDELAASQAFAHSLLDSIERMLSHCLSLPLEQTVGESAKPTYAAVLPRSIDGRIDAQNALNNRINALAMRIAV